MRLEAPLDWAMTVILVGALGKDVQKLFMVELIDVETPNYSTIQQAVISALHSLLGPPLVYSNVKLLLTDGSSYCFKVGKALVVIFPELIHMYCMAHGLNRVADMAKVIYPKVSVIDISIGILKKILFCCSR